MALSLENIRRARDAGYDDDQILESIERRDKEFGSRIKKARQAGYDSPTIMSSIENRLNQVMELEETEEPTLPTEDQLPQEEQPSFPGTQDQAVPSPLSGAQPDQGTPATTLVNSLQPPDEEVKGFWNQAKDWIMQEPGEDSYIKSIQESDLPDNLKKMILHRYQLHKGGAKGFLSGVTFGLSEKIPSLKPREDDKGVLLGEFLGSIIPIEGLAKVIGWPLVKLAGMSPKYKQGLEALARITGTGITGATYEGIKEGIKKEELPSPEELLKYGAEWAAFETVLQSLGYTARFVNALRKSKGNTVDKVNSVIKKVNLQENNPETLKKQLDEAMNEVFQKKTQKKGQDVHDLPEGSVFRKPEDIRIGSEGGKATASISVEKNGAFYPEKIELTKEEKQLIDASNSWDKAGDSKEASNFAEEAREMIYKRLTSKKDYPIQPQPKAEIEGVKKAVEKPEKKGNLPETQPETKKVPEQKQTPEAKQKSEVKEFEQKVENKETSKIQNKIDSINSRLEKAKKKGKTAEIKVLQKNLAIQKNRLKQAKKATEYSVPQNAKEVNTTQPTLVAENPESINNPNVVKAVSEKPVETLSKGMYSPQNRYTTAIKAVKSKIRKSIKSVVDRFGRPALKADPNSDLYKKGWESVKEWRGKKKSGEFISEKKWQKEITENKNISKQDREDMIFYRERTGNPFIKGDTFEALEKRMSPESKKVVDTVVDSHMKEALQALNDAPFIKQKVTPRKEVEDIYIRHMYAGKIDSKKIDSAYEAVQKRFKTDNPFANKRTYLTFNEALKEAGLVPKYRDITQFLAAQDAIMNRVISNNKLVHDLHNIEKAAGTKYISRSNNKKLYEQAKRDGWVPFEDAYLRSYVAGKSKSGKLKWAVTEAPALVHPDLASSLQGVFSKEAYKPDNAAVRMYDVYNSAVNKLHLLFSLFHFGALGESFTAKGGFITSLLRTPQWWGEGTALLNDVPYMADAIKHGLEIHLPKKGQMKQADTFYKNYLRTLQAHPSKPLRGIGNIADVTGPLTGMHNLLFHYVHPRMKIIQYENYVQTMIKHFNKKGLHPNEQLLKEIKEQAASACNDQFGGQAWELIPFLNNRKNLKGVQRVFSYPDWGVSAIREVSQALSSDSPIRRQIGRKYLVQYMLGLAFGTQMVSYFSTGWTNGPDGKMKWDAKKAHSTLENEDPKRRNVFDIQMPDVYITIAGEKINLGRDENGRQYYMHGGKKVREIGRYFHSPVAALFSKSNPLIQNALKFSMDHTPSEEGIFPVRGAYVEGEFRPWDGSQKWTKERAISMGKEVGTSILPYSFQTAISDLFDSKESWTQALARTGFKFAASGLGMLSVGKGISLRSSEPYWEKAFRIEDRYEREESLKALRVLLKGYGYKDRQIKSIETKIKRRVEGKAERR